MESVLQQPWREEENSDGGRRRRRRMKQTVTSSLRRTRRSVRMRTEEEEGQTSKLFCAPSSLCNAEEGTGTFKPTSQLSGPANIPPSWNFTPLHFSNPLASWFWNPLGTEIILVQKPFRSLLPESSQFQNPSARGFQGSKRKTSRT